MQRQLALQMPLAARNFSAVKPAADFNLDALRAKAQRLFDGFPHGAAKSDSLFELGRNLFRLQLGIQLRFMNFLDGNQDFAAGARRDITFQLIDFGSLAADDDARSRRIDDDLQTIRPSLDVPFPNPAPPKPTLHLAFQ